MTRDELLRNENIKQLIKDIPNVPEYDCSEIAEDLVSFIGGSALMIDAHNAIGQRFYSNTIPVAVPCKDTVQSFMYHVVNLIDGFIVDVSTDKLVYDYLEYLDILNKNNKIPIFIRRVDI